MATVAADTGPSKKGFPVGSRRTLITIAAVAVGALAVFLIYGYTSSVKDEAFGDAERVKVFVVSETVPKGTYGDEARTMELIVETEVPKRFYPENAIRTFDDIAGKVAVGDLAVNQFVTTDMFADPSTVQTTFSDRLEKINGEDQVAISIQVANRRAGPYPIPTAIRVAGACAEPNLVDLGLGPSRHNREGPVGDVTVDQHTPIAMLGRIAARGHDDLQPPVVIYVRHCGRGADVALARDAATGWSARRVEILRGLSGPDHRPRGAVVGHYVQHAVLAPDDQLLIAVAIEVNGRDVGLLDVLAAQHHGGRIGERPRGPRPGK